MACSLFTPLGGSCSKIIIHFLLSHNGGFLDGQIIVIHSDQLPGDLRLDRRSVRIYLLLFLAKLFHIIVYTLYPAISYCIK